MNKKTVSGRWQGVRAAVLLLITGAVIGVLVDRTLLAPARLGAAPLTADAMAQRLGLSPSESGRVRALLDSLHAEIVSVVLERPDSLRAVVRDAQSRIEAVLPEASRSEFRAWIEEHHEGMIGRMHHPPDHSGP